MIIHRISEKLKILETLMVYGSVMFEFLGEEYVLEYNLSTNKLELFTLAEKKSEAKDV